MTDAINIRHLNKWYGKYHALKNNCIQKGKKMITNIFMIFFMYIFLYLIS